MPSIDQGKSAISSIRIIGAKGVATEAAAMIIEFGFNDLELHRIYANCAPENGSSQKVLEKLGMSFEGRMRENLLLKEGWRDSNLYSILAREWPGKKGAL